MFPRFYKVKRFFEVRRFFLVLYLLFFSCTSSRVWGNAGHAMSGVAGIVSGIGSMGVAAIQAAADVKIAKINADAQVEMTKINVAAYQHGVLNQAIVALTQAYTALAVHATNLQGDLYRNYLATFFRMESSRLEHERKMRAMELDYQMKFMNLFLAREEAQKNRELQRWFFDYLNRIQAIGGVAQPSSNSSSLVTTNLNSPYQKPESTTNLSFNQPTSFSVRGGLFLGRNRVIRNLKSSYLARTQGQGISFGSTRTLRWSMQAKSIEVGSNERASLRSQTLIDVTHHGSNLYSPSQQEFDGRRYIGSNIKANYRHGVVETPD